MDRLLYITFVEDFLRGDYMPHGHCFLWQPGILWLTVLSDLVIGIAYFVISAALIAFIRKRQDLHYRGIFFLFGSFILWCGLTHLFAVHTIWHGAYGVMAIIKFITAVVSAFTAVILIKNFSDILRIPNVHEYQRVLEDAAQREIEQQSLEAQHKAESIFRFATELLPTGMLVINSQTQIVVANKSLEAMFGYATRELIGQPVSVLLNRNQADHHDLLIEQFLNNPSQGHNMAPGRVVKGLRKNGEEIAVEVTLSVYDLEGTPHAFASVVDCNSLNEEKQRFFEESTRLKRAIDAANDGIWEWNVKTDDVWYSAPLMRMIGHDPEKEAPSLDLWLEHIHPEDRPHVDGLLKRHFESKKKYDVIYRGLTQNNEYEWMHSRGDTVFDGNGEPLLMSGALTNINEKKLMEDKLAEQTRLLNVVLDKSLCGIYVFDIVEKKTIYVNKEFTNITGYSLNELHHAQRGGQISLFHPDEADDMIQHLDRVSQGEDDQGLSITYRFQHKKGDWIWCHSRDSVYLRDDQGKPTQIIGTFFDITEIKTTEKSLARSNAALERFAYSASHDLQEPLRKITAFSNSLENRLQEKLDDADARYELDRIANAASRMREMIDSLLQLSRYSRQKILKEPTRLNDILTIVKDDLSELLAESAAEIKLVRDVELSVDIHCFQQVLRNLISNSIRYARTDQNAEIEIDASTTENNTCKILVKDNGMGFREESAEEIFEPFKRLVGRTVPGSGMGLAICQQIIRAHGGSISAHSQAGVGATFIIELPLDTRSS